MYNEEALKSIYKYNMLFNNISNNNNTEEDAKYNTNLISDFDLENFDPKRYEYYTGLLKVFNNDPETLYNLLNKYNSIKSLKVKEKKIIREINDYVNKIKDINDNRPVDRVPAVPGGGRATIKTIGGADASNEIEKIKSKVKILLDEATNLIAKDGEVFPDVEKFINNIKTKDFNSWKDGLNDETIINTETTEIILGIKEAINLFKKDIALYKERHQTQTGGIEFKDILTNSDKDKDEAETAEINKKREEKDIDIKKQRKHEENVLAAEKLVLSAEKLVVQIENAITYISEKNNKVKDGLDEVFSELDKDNSKNIAKELSEITKEDKAKNKEANLKADSSIGYLNNAINANIDIGSELYKVSLEEQQGTSQKKKGFLSVFSKKTPQNEESNTKESADKAIDSLKDAIAPSISVGNELYKVADVGSKEIEKKEKTETKTAEKEAEAAKAAANSAIDYLKDAIAPSINIGDELYKVAKKASTAIENTEKKAEVDTKKITDAAEAEADKAINSLKDAIAPSISVGNELYKVADNVNKETEASTKKTEASTKKEEEEAKTTANSAIDSLKDAIAPSISVGNELYNIADNVNKTETKKEKTETKTAEKEAEAAKAAANSAIDYLKDAIAPSISVGNELYKVAEEANKAIKNEATEVDSAEANFIESIKGTALLNSISNIFDKFKGIEDLDIEKISPAATAEPTAPTTAATAAAAEQAAKAAKAAKDQAAKDQAVKDQAAKALEAKALEAEQAAAKAAAPGKDSQPNEDEDEDEDEDEESVNDWNKTHEEGEDEWIEDKVNNTDIKGETKKKKILLSLPPPKKKEPLPPQDLIPLPPRKHTEQRGGDPNQKYSDDNLKAQYLDTQRYNKIDDNKIINEYRKILNENKKKVVSIKTDNKIEQLSNDIDVYNSLDFDEKESKENTDNIIKKIKDFENDPKNPIEALELSFDDRIVFIIATFFIRYITIIMVQWCIDINIIKSFYEGFIYYAVIYIILFWFIVLFINIDNSFDVKYMNFNGIINSIRTLFYYFYMGTNGISRLLIHTSLILLLIVIPIILNIKKKPDFKDEDDQESIKILDYEERKQLSKALSLFTMFIWLFTSIIATKF